MGGILEFIREWADIRRESKSYCKSCETLKEQLNQVNHEKRMLLEQFLHPVTKETVQMMPESPKPIMPNIVPWSVKKQMLEQEDRAKAATLRRMEEDKKRAEAVANSRNKTTGPIEESGISVEELERELGVEDAV